MLNIYSIYYLLLYLTMNYTVDNENLHITGLWRLKKVQIPFSSIEGYKNSNDIYKWYKIIWSMEITILHLENM